MNQMHESARRAWKDTFNFKWVIGQIAQAFKIYFSYRVNRKITSIPQVTNQTNDTPNAC